MRFKISAFVALLWLTAFFAYGQTRRTNRPAPKPSVAAPTVTPTPPVDLPTRRVVVKLKDGRSLDADFLQASADQLEVRVAGNRLKIAMDEVAAIVLAPESAPVKTGPTQDELIGSVLRALKKLAGAVDVGINYLGYGSRLIDVKNEVDEPLSAIKDAQIKSDLSAILQAYVDAGQAWNQTLRGGSLHPDSDAWANLLQKKYDIPMELVDPGKNVPAYLRKTAPPGALDSYRIMRQDVVLNTIWKAAKARIDSASASLSK